MITKTKTLESYENYWVYFDEQYLYSISKKYPKNVKLEEYENLIELEGQEIFDAFNEKPFSIGNAYAIIWKLKLKN